jgi:hypothetical protein
MITETGIKRFGEPLASARSVRHMSVTTAMQRLTMAHNDTQRDNTKTASEPGYAQLTCRFRRWWQVQDSNLGRRSRRFYRNPSLPIGMPADLRILHSSPRESRVLSVWRP